MRESWRRVEREGRRGGGREEEKSRKVIEDREAGDRKGEQSADCRLVKENKEEKGERGSGRRVGILLKAAQKWRDLR